MSRLQIEGLTKRFGSDVVLSDVELDIEPGELVAVIGPSGSGKSTLLRLVAGLEQPDSGSITIDGARVHSDQPWLNGVAMVFQDEALYEHMTVGGNLSFPLLVAGSGKEVATRRASEEARKLRIRRLLPRRPKTLSSGERGMVATGRALSRDDIKLLLLDEPLARADRQVRLRFRGELARLQRETGLTTLFATNDQEEAMAVADRLVVLIDGRVEQVGPPLEVFDRPVNTVVASFMGSVSMNLIPALVEFRQRGWWATVGHDTIELGVSLPDVYDGRRVTLGIHPHEFHPADKSTPFQRTLKVTVGLVEDLGGSTAVHFGLGSTGGAGLVWTEQKGPSRERGDRCELTWHPLHLRVFDVESGRAIETSANVSPDQSH